MSRLTQLIEDMEAARKRFRAEGEAALKEAVRELFEQVPELTAIGWTQYAPYFNDGEECEFGVHEIYATDHSLDGEEELDIEELANGAYDIIDNDAVNAFLREFARMPDEIFEDLFGNDSMIMITRDGIKVEDYSDHD